MEQQKPAAPQRRLKKVHLQALAWAGLVLLVVGLHAGLVFRAFALQRALETKQREVQQVSQVLRGPVPNPQAWEARGKEAQGRWQGVREVFSRKEANALVDLLLQQARASGVELLAITTRERVVVPGERTPAERLPVTIRVKGDIGGILSFLSRLDQAAATASFTDQHLQQDKGGRPEFTVTVVFRSLPPER